jgi:hypothetical protein
LAIHIDAAGLHLFAAQKCGVAANRTVRIVQELFDKRPHLECELRRRPVGQVVTRAKVLHRDSSDVRIVTVRKQHR